jgi:hypothetical protein
MATSVDARLDRIHPRMLRVSGDPDPQQLGKQQIGAAIDKALARAGLTNKEAAFTMGYTDSGVIGRWTAGTETPQFAKLWMLGAAFRRELVIALAETEDGVEIKTVVEIRRTA